ncbi:hypothetical protein QNH14_06820 [Apirhabdus apintestini]|uniref:hypothetical protein n=1 Tax=Erwinia sp. HR93 TaxID=3094840 RepID=UPI002ADEEC45|nr:hypothetical protein [Erwinia sp. HR93]MEA1065376.1 hypothetical protein [Erwinia sp. HR93]WPM85609.1 hypothetical protein QNH14_06820 [Enterobacteriaceae bacterium CA-0114]
MIKKPALLFGMLLLSACASQEKISSIDTGMSRQQIITALGNPDSEYSKDDLEILTYRNKKPKALSLKHEDYQVVLINDIAAEITPETRLVK